MAKIDQGAGIIIREWIRLRKGEALLIVSSPQYEREARAMEQCARELTDRVEIQLLEEMSLQVGVWFDEHEDAFDSYDAVIGATEYSLITTKAVRRAIKRRARFLSLPLSTNDGRSMLEYDFLNMDVRRSRIMARIMMRYFNAASVIRVYTDLGTELRFSIRGRRAGFFNGCCKDGKGFSSASIEVYVPVEEEETEGTLMLDGSMGYIGAVKEPVEITLRRGRIVGIAQNENGRKLKQYIESYGDARMFTASEFGIGLNFHSNCEGNCYIEDESAYGTFHIGFGRNLALGGVMEANGHYDLVTKRPDIYVDNRMIMQEGRIMTAEMQMYV